MNAFGKSVTLVTSAAVLVPVLHLQGGLLGYFASGLMLVVVLLGALRMFVITFGVIGWATASEADVRVSPDTMVHRTRTDRIVPIGMACSALCAMLAWKLSWFDLEQLIQFLSFSFMALLVTGFSHGAKLHSSALNDMKKGTRLGFFTLPSGGRLRPFRVGADNLSRRLDQAGLSVEAPESSAASPAG